MRQNKKKQAGQRPASNIAKTSVIRSNSVNQSIPQKNSLVRNIFSKGISTIICLLRRLKRFKRSIVCFLMIVLNVGICLGGYLYLMTSVPTKIAGEISEFGDVELSYNSVQNAEISPLCGCYEKPEADHWRGVTFLARHLTLHRTGTHPKTAYFVTAAMPDTIRWYASSFRLQGIAYTLEITNDGAFDPHLLLSSKFPSSYRVLSKKVLKREEAVLFVTGEKLNVDLLGDKPFASWIPVEDSRVSLKYQKDAYAKSKGTATIEEVYKNWSEETIKDSPTKADFSNTSYPIADFIGPNIVLWSDDETAVVASNHELSHQILSTASSSQRRKITAVLITKPPFSARVACMPYAEEHLQKYMQLMKSDIPQYAFAERGSGRVEITIEDPEGQNRKAGFDKIRQSLERDDTVYVSDIPIRGGTFADQDDPNTTWSMPDNMLGVQFRYPPLPPNKGFNIFGQVNNLKFSSAKGNLTVGTRPLEIATTYELELKNIKQQKVKGDVIPIPIQITDQKANLDIEVTSEVIVNGEAKNRMSDAYGLQTNYVMILCGIVGTVATVLSLALALKQTAPTKPT